MLYEICNGGRFISRGRGQHPTRRIDSDELIYVLRGELAIFEEKQSFRVAAGEWLFLRRGRRHGGLALYPRNLSFFWLHFRALDDWLDEIPQQGAAENPAALAAYAQNFLNEQSRIEPDPRILDLLFQLIVCEIRRRGAAPAGRVTPLAEAARQHLALHYAEPLTLDRTAAVLRCSAEYLGRLYRHTYGETFLAALNRRRIEAAAARLAEGGLSIKETAARCGFNDLAYFRRQFRRFYNLTPGAFRRLHAGGHRNTE